MRQDAGMSADERPTEGLGWLPRAIAGVVATASLVFGGRAVFVTTNEAGSVSLILVGGVFAYLAVSGQALRRLKMGDNEAEFSKAVFRVAMRTVEGGGSSAGDGTSTEAAAAKILEQAAREAPSVPRKVLAATEAHRYEEAVIAALRRVAETVSTDVGHHDRGADAVVNGTVAVQIKYANKPVMVVDLNGGGLLDESKLEAPDGFQALLCVTHNVMIMPPTNDNLSISVGRIRPRVKVVHWNPVMGDAPLAEALADLG